MTLSNKGAFLSGLVFPGLGQVFFKRYKKGLALIATVIISLLIIVAKATKQTFAILARMELKGEIIDLQTLCRAAAEASHPNESFMTLLLWILIICCWFFATIDAYRIGKEKERGQIG